MSNSFATPWTVACQDPLSMGFSRQEYWSGLQFPSPGGLPDPGIKPASSGTPALQEDSLPLSHQGSPFIYIYIYIYLIVKWKNRTLYIYRWLYQNRMGTINTKQKTTIDTHIQKKKSPKHNNMGLPW